MTDGLKGLLFQAIDLSDAAVEMRFLIWFPCVALLSLAICMLVFRFIEKPCVDLGKKGN